MRGAAVLELSLKSKRVTSMRRRVAKRNTQTVVCAYTPKGSLEKLDYLRLQLTTQSEMMNCCMLFFT